MNLCNSRIDGFDIFIDVLTEFIELSLQFSDLFFDSVCCATHRNTSTSTDHYTATAGGVYCHRLSKERE